MLTKKNKLIITEDWKKKFPTLDIYKPMHLLNRIGPLVVGIYLEENSDNESYQPVFHVHNLLKEFPVVSLELYNTILNNPIKYKHHNEVINDYFIKFKEKILIPFEGDVALERVLMGYRNYLLNPTYPYQQSVYEDMILLSTWCENQNSVLECLDFARNNMEKWPEYIIERMNGIDTYLNQLLNKSYDLLSLNKNYEKQILTLKLDHLPKRKLLR